MVSDQPTFRWHARHDFERWVAVDTTSEEGCDPLWSARLSHDAASGPGAVPGQHATVACSARCCARAVPAWSGPNSMTEYTGPQRDAVRELAHACDVLFLNESELASLTGAPVTTWRQEAIAMCGVGPAAGGRRQRRPTGRVAGHRRRRHLPPARPGSKPVVDPTGGGRRARRRLPRRLRGGRARRRRLLRDRARGGAALRRGRDRRVRAGRPDQHGSYRTRSAPTWSRSRRASARSTATSPWRSSATSTSSAIVSAMPDSAGVVLAEADAEVVGVQGQLEDARRAGTRRGAGPVRSEPRRGGRRARWRARGGAGSPQASNASMRARTPCCAASPRVRGRPR